MAREVLPVVRHTPVLAGVNGTDPFMIRDDFLRRLGELGFSGVQNFPTVGIIDGVFRANLEETGMGYGLEVELIRAARAHDLLTTPYVFSEDNARRWRTRAPTSSSATWASRPAAAIGAETALSLADCVPRIEAWAAAARAVREDVLVLCHGGPIATPDDARLHPARLPRLRRLLRRLQHGAAAHRDRAHRDHRARSKPFVKRYPRGRDHDRRQFGQFILGLIVVAAVVAIGVWLLNWLYLRSSKERAFVRTGFGGQKVVHERRRAACCRSCTR